MFYYYDPTYWLIILGAIVALYAQIKVSTTYSKWSKVPSSTRMTGAQMARQILDGNGCENVRIERISGKLTITMTRKTACSACPARSTVRIPSRRWAWPRTKRDTPFRTRQDYAPLRIRSTMVPIANIGSGASIPLFMLGLILSWEPLVKIGIFCFALAVLFYVVTLPVEFNASGRAVRCWKAAICWKTRCAA